MKFGFYMNVVNWNEMDNEYRRSDEEKKTSENEENITRMTPF